jgi:hypothetical protein
MARGPQGKQIEQMWAWTTVDPQDDTEGVIGVHTPDGWLPLVGADRARMESVRPIVQSLAAQGGFTATLVQFTDRVVIDAVTPDSVAAGERKG